MSIALKHEAGAKPWVATWVFSLIFFVFLIVVVGGITRLTESGLSIVEWKPITGFIPPLTETQWQEEFAKYKQYPEFQKINSHFELSDFQFIYFWEYLHRLLGRLMGVLFVVPWFFFWRKNVLTTTQHRKLWLAFFLGGCQGVLGWYMVKSGLVDRPDVSHLRLAAHLGLALLIMAHLMWFVLDYLMPETQGQHPKRSISVVFLVLISVQIIYGAFTAGLDAGFVYNTFPKMGAFWVAPQIWDWSPWYLGPIENPIAIQFIHRWIGTGLFFFSLWIWWTLSRGQMSPRQSLSLRLVLVAIAAQVALGIITLIFTVPVPIAALHQAGAVVLLLTTLFWAHSMYRCPQSYSIMPIK